MQVSMEPTMMNLGRTQPSPERPSAPNQHMTPTHVQTKRFTTQNQMHSTVAPYQT